MAAPSSVHIKGLFSRDDIRQTIVDAGGGGWNRGTLSLILSLNGHHKVRVTTVAVNRDTAPTPAWAYLPLAHPPTTENTACGGSIALETAYYDADLDRSRLTPHAFNAGEMPTNRQFMLDEEHRFFALFAYAGACLGNYRWTLTITYYLDHERRTRTLSSAPFLLYGLAKSTLFYQGYQDRDGSIHATSYRRTGADPSCVNTPGATPMQPLPEAWQGTPSTASPSPPASSPSPSEGPAPSPSASSPSPSPTPSSTPSPSAGSTP